jgi:RNA polymerase sigma factor (TIGR02999 family)
VVNEACLRIMKSGLPDVTREERLALAGRVLKQVLVDHARARGAEKRGGGEGVARVEFGENVLAKEATLVDLGRVQRAMERLHTLSERQAEVVTLRMFSGLTMDHVATVMGVSKRTAEAEWTIARAWLRRELSETAP